jgi:transposase
MACLKTWEYQGRHGRRMSKARLVITAVVTEGRSQGEVARAYGVSQGWVSRLVARFRAEGEAAFEPRSRRPRTSPTAISAGTADLIITLRKDLAGQGLDAGPQTIAWHLQHHYQIRVAPATISRYLARAGLVTPDPAKRPKSSYLRFDAELPNERDGTDPAAIGTVEVDRILAVPAPWPGFTHGFTHGQTPLDWLFRQSQGPARQPQHRYLAARTWVGATGFEPVTPRL